MGHGFDSFRWTFPPFGHFLPNHAHNELLQTFFTYGLVGLVIVIALYWSFYRQVRSSQDDGLRSLAMAVLILVLVRGVVDTDQFDLGFPLWLMTMLSVALSHTAFSKGPFTSMKQKPSLSIVTPSFNQAAFIGEGRLPASPSRTTPIWSTW